MEKNTVQDCQTIEKVYNRIQELEQEPLSIKSPEDFEALELEILTNHLSALLLQKKFQAALDSEEQQAKEAELIKNWPGRMKSEGFETVKILTAGGAGIEVRVRYYRRSCDRRNGKRHKGVSQVWFC